MTVNVVGVSDVGAVRDINEDSIAIHQFSDECMLAVLADGMGGYRGGEIASKLCVEVMVMSLRPYLDNPGNHIQTEQQLLHAAQAANDRVYQLRLDQRDLSRMGTTLIAVVINKGQFSVIHAGDSRCYQQRKNQALTLITRDDSVVQAMLDDGTVTLAEADRVPFKHILSKAVGVEKTLNYSVATHVWLPGQCLLLCSDGLYNTVTQERFGASLVAPGSLQKRAEGLLQDCLSLGASDNVSFIMIENDM